MNLQSIRFLHVEDDWEQFLSLPNNLYDSVYARSDAEIKFQLDFEEQDDPTGPGDCASYTYRWLAYLGETREKFFEYCFIESVEALQTIQIRPNDFLIVDIMQIGDEGSAQEVVSDVCAHAETGSSQPLGRLYYSAYPEMKPTEIEMTGFEKIEVDQFIWKLQTVLYSQFPSFEEKDEEWKLTVLDLGIKSLVEKYDG